MEDMPNMQYVEKFCSKNIMLVKQTNFGEAIK